MRGWMLLALGLLLCACVVVSIVSSRQDEATNRRYYGPLLQAGNEQHVLILERLSTIEEKLEAIKERDASGDRKS